jgi:hypothetical protein
MCWDRHVRKSWQTIKVRDCPKKVQLLIPYYSKPFYTSRSDYVMRDCTTVQVCALNGLVEHGTRVHMQKGL